MSTYLRVLGPATLMFFVIIAFQNCSENLAGGPEKTTLSSGSPSPGPSPGPLPGPGPGPLPTQKQVVLTSGNSWTVPADVGTIDSVECWGAGGGSRTDNDGASYGAAGGGAYAKITNVVFNPGSLIAYNLGSPGISSNTSNGSAGGDTWFISALTVMAKGGLGSSNMSPGVAGGSAAASVGTVKFSGGRGGAANGLGGAGGGGAGSALNNGADGGSSDGNNNNGALGGLSPGGAIGGSGTVGNATPVSAGPAPSNVKGGGGGGGGGGQDTGISTPPGAPAGGGGAGGFPGGGAGSTGAISGNGFGTSLISGNGGGGQIIIIYTTK